MTLSSNSRQNRKSMLPTPRLSSRLSSRRAASGETFRGARSVPSPLLVTPASFNKGSAMHSRAPYLAAAMSRRLQLPELGSRRAGSPSRIPLPSLAGGQVSYPTTLEHSVAGAHYPTPPASVEAKHERAYKGQDRDASSTPVQQQQSNNARVPAPPPPIPTQHVYRRPASTTLTITPALSQIENSSLGSSAPHALAMKKSALTSSVSGKENRRPKSRMRVPVLSPTPASTPVAPIASVPPRPSQQLLTQVSRASSRETLPRPLVVRKRLRDAFSPNSDSSREGSQPNRLDLDRFAKEWTGMFDELYADADDGRVEATTDAEMPIHPVPESEVAGLHPTWTRKQTGYQETRGAGIGKNESREPDENRAVLSTTSESTVSVNSSQGSSLVSGDGETVNFDVTAASLVRWQHRDNTMLKDAPVETKSKADIPDMVPASPPSYPPTDTASRHSQKAGFRSAPSPITPQISRYPPLPEVNDPRCLLLIPIK
ncbi:hypothetical protein B0F90DRAFT_1752780 [Multifurca ochricompacta]|uniref:Uncharacterized protein n=1 Tax=Multifurca ochricompacta TaxID=376703 RepID=A0AAD4LY91_9AGAM|nr:hypothetical protein B0F90DRAFT_1752780 [Multifurca ochricompacta]